jgi:hypothetical protein
LLDDEDFEPDTIFKTSSGNAAFIFEGAAYTSHEVIGRGLHVFGAGRYLYLPPSSAQVLEEIPPCQRTVHWKTPYGWS